MSEKTLTPEEIAEVASKKCYKKHSHEFSDERLGKKLNIKNQKEFEEHIQATLKDPKTLAVKADNGRNLYYNQETNTFISQNNIRPDKCTSFRPEEKEGYFLEKAKHECVDRRGIDQSKWEKEIKEGGYPALHSRDQEKSNKEEKAQRIKEKLEKLQQSQKEKDKDRDR